MQQLKQRKLRARNKKPGAKQQRILDKYKDIVMPPYSMFDRSEAARAYRKMRSALKQVNQYKDLIKTGPQFLKLTPLEIRKIRVKMYSLQNMFLTEKSTYYKEKDRKKISETTSGEEILETFDDGISEDEQNAIDEIKDKLENYRPGDETITKYYHVYGFDSISDESIYYFARMEGILR